MYGKKNIYIYIYIYIYASKLMILYAYHARFIYLPTYRQFTNEVSVDVCRQTQKRIYPYQHTLSHKLSLSLFITPPSLSLLSLSSHSLTECMSLIFISIFCAISWYRRCCIRMYAHLPCVTHISHLLCAVCVFVWVFVFAGMLLSEVNVPNRSYSTTSSLIDGR